MVEQSSVAVVSQRDCSSNSVAAFDTAAILRKQLLQVSRPSQNADEPACIELPFPFLTTIINASASFVEDLLKRLTIGPVCGFRVFESSSQFQIRRDFDQLVESVLKFLLDARCQNRARAVRLSLVVVTAL